jgi:hypothetical protein
MDISYHLTGTFIEACNCKVICPCWVDDTPDEDHCAGLFAWVFDDDATIAGHPVGGRSLVSATIHGDSRRGGTSESVIYVDDALSEPVKDLLVAAFSGKGGGTLADLAQVTGEVLDAARADINITTSTAGWLVQVRASDATTLIRVTGVPELFNGSSEPLTLRHTALSAELGTLADPVTAQRTGILTIDVAALPGPMLEVTGRSGMTGRFAYHGKPEAGAGDPPDPAAGPGHAG